MFVNVRYFFLEVSLRIVPKSMLGGRIYRFGKHTSPYKWTKSFWGWPIWVMFSFPDMLSDNLSYFIPGSKSINIEPVLAGARVNFSVAQLNGGSILRLIEVGKGPPFVISKVFVIGIEATPFSHKYLKNSLASEKFRPGVINSPWTVVFQTVFGFLSPPTVTLQAQVSMIFPTLNELALNYIGIPILGLRLITSGTTAKTNLISSYVSSFAIPETTD